MIRFLLAGTAIVGFCQAAAADSRHASVKPITDDGIRVETYSPTKRYTVVGVIGQPTVFTFPQNEDVYLAPQSHAKAWHKGEPITQQSCDPKDQKCNASPGNHLILYPETEGETLMTVITAIDGDIHKQKPYSFRLVAVSDPTGKPDIPGATYNIIFAGGIPTALRKPKTEASNPVSPAAPPPPIYPTSYSNTHYHPHGNPASPIAQALVSAADNGQWTRMRFPGLSAKPTVYTGHCDGKDEHMVRQHGDGEYIIAETIAPSFCLRLGNGEHGAALEVINDGYSPFGNPTGTGTTSPNDYRDVLQASKK